MNEVRHQRATTGRGTLRGAAAVFLLGGLLTSLAVAAPPAREPEPKRPSLLLVTLDTTRADHLGCYGRRPSPTPTLDELARTGTVFLEAVSPAPLTLPAHASLMTGLPPRLHGARDNAPDRLGPSRQTLAAMLRAEGYDTGAVIAAAVLDRSTGIGRGFRLFDDRVRVGPRKWFDWRERGASQVADAAARMLSQLRPPFLLWVHFYDPHLPFVAPEPWATRFADSPYDAEIAFADHALGELLERARARAPELLVAVAGDHGEALGEHGEKDHGVLLHHATTHIPLLLSGPGVPRAKRLAETVGLVDLAPTLLDLLGAPPLEKAEGRSLSPLMTGAARRGRRADTALYELEALHGERAYGWHGLRGIQRGRFKLVAGRELRLFDVVADPRERTNLLASHPAQARDLRARLEQNFAEEHPPAPAGPPDAEAQAQLERLRSLGYAGGATVTESDSGPDPHEAIFWLADLDEARRLIASGGEKELRRAISLIDRLLERNPGNRPARLSLIGALRGAGKLQRAIGAAEEAARRWPDDYLVHFHLAQVFATAATRARGAEAERLASRARTAFSRCLELHPRFADAHLARATFELERGRPRSALAATSEALEREVADADIDSLRGELLAAGGDLQGADAAFAAALELDPSHRGALEGRARLAYLGGDPVRAEAIYAELLRRHPSAATARTLGAIRWLELGDREGARKALERALQLEPQGPDAQEVRELLGEIAGAPGGSP